MKLQIETSTMGNETYLDLQTGIRTNALSQRKSFHQSHFLPTQNKNTNNPTSFIQNNNTTNYTLHNFFNNNDNITNNNNNNNNNDKNENKNNGENDNDGDNDESSNNGKVVISRNESSSIVASVNPEAMRSLRLETPKNAWQIVEAHNSEAHNDTQVHHKRTSNT